EERVAPVDEARQIGDGLAEPLGGRHVVLRDAGELRAKRREQGVTHWLDEGLEFRDRLERVGVGEDRADLDDLHLVRGNGAAAERAVVAGGFQIDDQVVGRSAHDSAPVFGRRYSVSAMSSAPGHDPGQEAAAFSWAEYVAWVASRHGSLAGAAERLAALRGYR